jgi:hypothetical protein
MILRLILARVAPLCPLPLSPRHPSSPSPPRRRLPGPRPLLWLRPARLSRPAPASPRLLRPGYRLSMGARTHPRPGTTRRAPAPPAGPASGTELRHGIRLVRPSRVTPPVHGPVHAAAGSVRDGLIDEAGRSRGDGDSHCPAARLSCLSGGTEAAAVPWRRRHCVRFPPRPALPHQDRPGSANRWRAGSRRDHARDRVLSR